MLCRLRQKGVGGDSSCRTQNKVTESGITDIQYNSS